MNQKKLYIISLIGILFQSSLSYGLDQITRPYQSVRSAGMGGVRYTTGLYDENFFGNPARATANPGFRITLLDPMVESTTSTISQVGTIAGGSNVLSNLSDTSGTNLHGRIQLTMPSVYFQPGKMSYAVGLITSAQFDLDLRKSFQLEPDAVIDIGPAITVARKLLKDDALSVGITAHATYRLSANEDFSLINLLQGTSISPSSNGGEGAHIDFDVGGTYRLPWKPLGFDFNTALAINNILGGNYSNLGIRIADLTSRPTRQPRTLNFGGSLSKDTLWIFRDFVFALEITDIGNSGGGSFFRLIHFGSEAKWGIISTRLGFNQGYITAGLGFDFSFFTIDLATYGEELALNAGELQDRRLAVKFAFQI